MAVITQSVVIAAPIDAVWREATDLPAHAEWMADAESIEFVTEQRSGVGTRMKVATVIGPFRTTDVMEVTEWEPPKTVGVRHRGLITGSGRFVLAPMAGGTQFSWIEELSFPWYVGGPVAALLAAPVLGWIWKRNLRALKTRIERATAGTAR